MKTASTKPKLIFLSCSAALFLLLWLAHGVAFDAPLYFDTLRHLVDKTNLHVTEWSAETINQAVRLHYDDRIYRPVSYFSFAVNHYFTGLSPRWFRITNLLIHFATALGVIFMFRQVFRSPKLATEDPEEAKARTLALFLGVAIWLLHPIQTNVVTYVIQRMASLVALFLFLSVGCYLKARLAGGKQSLVWFAAALAAAVASVASKENGVVVVPLIFVAEWLLFGNPYARKGRRRNIAILLSLVAALLIAWKGPAVWVTLWNRGYHLRDYDAWERVLTQARLQFWYLFILLVPDPRILTLDADPQVSRGLLAPPSTLAAMVFIAGLLVLALRRHRKNPLLSLGILWFFIAQSVESTIISLELYYEHRMYIPAPFLYFGISYLLVRGAAGLRLDKRIAAVAAIALFCGLGAATHARNEVWADPIAFYGDAMVKAPAKARPKAALAVELMETGRHDEADALLKEALAITDKPWIVYMNLAANAKLKGDMAGYEEYLLKVIDRPGRLGARSNRFLALLEYERSNMTRARLYAEKSLEFEPRDPVSLTVLGAIHDSAGNLEEAQEAILKVVRYDPNNPGGWINLAAVLLKKEKLPQAADAYRKARELLPTGSPLRESVEAKLEELADRTSR